MSVKYNEHIERLKLMASGDDAWDLSDNDIAAIKYALGEINAREPKESRADD